MNTNENTHLINEVTREGYNVSITSLCKSMVDYFAHNENVAGSIPAEAPYKSNALSYSLLIFSCICNSKK